MDQTEKTLMGLREELVKDAVKSLRKLRELAQSVETCLETTEGVPLFFDDLMAHFNSLSAFRGAINGLDLALKRSRQNTSIRKGKVKQWATT